MSTGNESRQDGQFITETAADVLTSTGDCAVTYPVRKPITVLRVKVDITTLVSSSVDAVVRFDRRIALGSDTGKLLGLDGTTAVAGTAVVNIPTATAVGKVVYKDVRVDLNAGDEIVPTVVTAATSAGAARYTFEYINRHETAANQPHMVKSS